MIQALLDAAADPNAKNEDGWTPLHQAPNIGVSNCPTARNNLPPLLTVAAGTGLNRTRPEFAHRELFGQSYES